MKKLLLASFASVTIATAGVGLTSNTSTADAAETTQANNDVYSEFIAAGGTKALWDNIVMLECTK